MPIIFPARDLFSDLLPLSFGILSSPKLSPAFHKSNLVVVFFNGIYIISPKPRIAVGA